MLEKRLTTVLTYIMNQNNRFRIGMWNIERRKILKTTKCRVGVKLTWLAWKGSNE